MQASVEPKEYRFPAGVVVVRGHHARITLHDTPDLPSVNVIVRAMAENGWDGDGVVLVDCVHLGSLPRRGAADALASGFDRYACRIAVVTRSLLARAITRFQIATRPSRAVRELFTSIDSAERWLLQERDHEHSTIDTPGSTVSVMTDGIVQIRLKNAPHTLDNAKKNVNAGRAAVESTGRRTAPIVLDMRGTTRLPNSEARRYYRTPESYQHVARLAIIVGSARSVFFGNLVLRFAPQQTPRRLFANEADAVAWLRDGAHAPTEGLSEHADQQRTYVESLLATLSSYGVLDFSARMPLQASDELWQAIAAAVNMLGEELELSATAKAALEAERDKLTRIFSGLNEVAIVSVTDAEGRILEVNDRFCAISGFTRRELIGLTHAVVNSGFHPSAFFRDMWKTIASKRPWRAEICNRAKDGSLYWVDSTIIPLLDQSGNIANYFSVRHDVTARKNTEASLISAAKMASVGEMAGGIAHEINNPIAIIEGSAERILKALQQPTLDKDSLEFFAKSIMDTTRRVAGIVNGLRTLARDAEADPHEAVAVADILHDVLAVCAERLRSHGVTLSITVAPDAKVIGNRTQLSQVFLNLLANADDALRDQPERWIKIGTRVHDAMLQIEVTDSGKGIPPAIAGRLFVPFFTTKEPGKGTGLGLSLCRKIVAQHRGEMLLDSQCPNTRFVVRLPRAA